MTVYQSVVPRECAHCPVPVVPDGRGGWVHANGRGYGCRDHTNVLTGKNATPTRHPSSSGFTSSTQFTDYQERKAP